LGSVDSFEYLQDTYYLLLINAGLLFFILFVCCCMAKCCLRRRIRRYEERVQEEQVRKERNKAYFVDEYTMNKYYDFEETDLDNDFTENLLGSFHIDHK